MHLPTQNSDPYTVRRVASFAAYDVLTPSYTAKGGYSPSSLRVRILMRKMPSQKPLCSALMPNYVWKVLRYSWFTSMVPLRLPGILMVLKSIKNRPTLHISLNNSVTTPPSRHGPDFHLPQSQICIVGQDFHLRQSQKCLLGIFQKAERMV